MNTVTHIASFAVLAGALLLGTSLPGPSAEQEARDTAAVLREAQRQAAADHDIERTARRICQHTHSAGAVHRWGPNNELICHRSALVAQAEDAQALRVALTGKQPKE